MTNQSENQSFNKFKYKNATSTGCLVRVYVGTFMHHEVMIRANEEAEWQEPRQDWRYDNYFYPPDGSRTLAAGLNLTVFDKSLQCTLKMVGTTNNYYIEVTELG